MLPRPAVVQFQPFPKVGPTRPSVKEFGPVYHGELRSELSAFDHRTFERIAIVERYLHSGVVHRVIMSSTGDEDDIA